mgnify:CR=1 FL=1
MLSFFLFQAEDGIRDLVRSRGLGDVYKRQLLAHAGEDHEAATEGLWHSLSNEWYVLLLVVLNLSLIHI